MARKPAYCHHKSKGLAYVRIDGRQIYLGAFGSPESKSRYREIVDQWRLEQSVDRHTLTVGELVLRYFEHCKTYYVKNGKPTSEQDCIRSAMRPLTKRYRSTRVAEFGPVKLAAVRDDMIAADFAIRTIRKHIGRIRSMFKWAVSQELIAVGVYQALMTLPGLQAGRSGARVTDPVTSVALAHIDAVKPLVGIGVRGLIEFQLLTGARPGEAVQVRLCDIEMTGNVWEYITRSHKTEHHDKQRRIAIGPRCQQLVREYMTTDTTAPLFPNRFGNAYTVHGYRCIIRRACQRAKVPIWKPNQLRHTAATRIRREGGIEIARVVLGHSSAVTSELYAEKDRHAAQALALKMG